MNPLEYSRTVAARRLVEELQEEPSERKRALAEGLPHQPKQLPSSSVHNITFAVQSSP
jgi:hypothetical protein